MRINDESASHKYHLIYQLILIGINDKLMNQLDSGCQMNMSLWTISFIWILVMEMDDNS